MRSNEEKPEPKPDYMTIDEKRAKQHANDIRARFEMRHDKLERHVTPTHDAQGNPDGGVTSAIRGHVCYRCGLAADMILESKNGATCNPQRFAEPVMDDETED